MNFGLNNALTASRTNCFLSCPRKHFWACEVGLVKTQVSFALRFGTAWANAMEARWNGLPYAIFKPIPGDQELVDGALFHAQKDGTLDAYGCATIAALLAAYYEFYGEAEEEGHLLPEVQFRHDLGHGFTAEGKLDALGELKDGAHAIIESKTTGESIEPDAVYWLRLQFNVQLCQYVIAARKEGWRISKVFYDVTRKPSIKPKFVDDKDEKGLKIVVNQQGERVKLEAGKNKGEWRQSGDSAKGYYAKNHLETPDEFCDRLYRDALSRPTFYFARREVAILPAMLEQFETQRLVIAQQITHLRSLEQHYARAGALQDYWLSNRTPEVWPRNVCKDTCNFCSFKGFCLQNIPIDLNQLPEGYELKQFNPELQYDATTETDEAAAAE